MSARILFVPLRETSLIGIAEPHLVSVPFFSEMMLEDLIYSIQTLTHLFLDEERRTDSVTYDHSIAHLPPHHPYLDASRILLDGRRFLGLHWPHGSSRTARFFRALLEESVPVVVSLAEHEGDSSLRR